MALAEAGVTGWQNDWFPCRRCDRRVERMKAGELSKIDACAHRPLRIWSPQPGRRWVQQPAPAAFRVQLCGALPEGERGMSGSYLMGRLPELVFRTEGRAFKTHPLAGSAPRIAELQ